MGTEAGSIGISTRPAGSTPWIVAIAVLAAAALIMSTMALIVAARDRAITGVAGGGIHGAANAQAALWDTNKLAAMQGRVLAESIRGEDPGVLWDQGRLEAMEGRVLAG